MSRESRLTTHSSHDASTKSRTDKSPRERSASWDRNKQPSNSKSLSEAKEDLIRTKESDEIDMAKTSLRHRLKSLGTSMNKILSEAEISELEEGVRRLTLDTVTDTSVKRKHQNDDDIDEDANLGAVGPIPQSRDSPPRKAMTPDPNETLPFLPRVSEAVYEDEGSDIDEDPERYHDDANIDDDDVILRQVWGISGKQIETLKAQIDEKNNTINGLRRTIDRKTRDYEQTSLEQEEALLNKDEEIRKLTELNNSLTYSLSTMTRECEDMRQACHMLEEKLTVEETDRNEIDRGNKTKIAQLERELREMTQLRDFAETELDRKVKEGMLDSSRLKITIATLKDEINKAAEATEEIETRFKTKLNTMKDALTQAVTENETLKVEYRDMRARVNKFKRGCLAGAADMKRSASQLNLSQGGDVMMLGDNTDDDEKGDEIPKLTTKESLQLLSQVKWPKPEIFYNQLDTYINALDEHIESTRQRGLSDKDIAQHLHNDLIASSLAANYSSHSRQVDKTTTKGILDALRSCNRLSMLTDNHTKFGELEPGKNENRPSYMVRLNNAYVDYNLGDKSDSNLWEKQKNRAVRDQFFKGAKIPEHIRYMLATCLDLDEIVLCVETELRKMRNEPQQQRAPIPRQPRPAPRQFQQEQQFAPIGQTHQQNRFPGQNSVQQQGRNYTTSGNWPQQPRGPVRPPYQQQQRQQQPQQQHQQQQRTSPQTTQSRSPQQQRGFQSQNSAFQQRQSLNPNAPPYSRNSETNHAQINALMDEVRANVQRHAMTNDHGDESRESEQ